MKCDIKFMCIEPRMMSVAKTCSQLGLKFSEDVYVDYEMSKNPYLSSEKAFALPHKKDITHRCVVQDDVIVCEDFQNVLDELVNSHPNAVFSLFCTSKKMCNFPNYTILRTGGQIWGAAVIIPIKYLDAMREDHRLSCPSLEHDDVFYSDYCWRNKIPVLTTIPNVVQCNGMESSMGHSFKFQSPCCSLVSHVGKKWVDRTKASLGMPHGFINYEKRTEYYYQIRKL